MLAKLFYPITLTTLILGLVESLENTRNSSSLFSSAKFNQYNNNTQQLLTSELIPDSHLVDYLKDELFSDRLMKLFNYLIFNPNRLDEDELIKQDAYKLVAIGKIAFSTYSSLTMHRYDRVADLKLSGGPQVNQERCLEQLDHVIDRFSATKYGDRVDSTIEILMFSYGRVPSGFHGGHTTWPGRYTTCKNSKLQLPGQQHDQPMRYCFAMMKDHRWSTFGRSDEFIAIETAVCLPKTCDSLHYKHKFQLVQQLIYLNDQEFKTRNLSVSNLYCLPDDESPIRQWWMSESTRVVVIVFGVWLAVLIMMTIVYERNERKRNEVAEEKVPEDAAKLTLTRVSAALSLTKNLKSLLNTDLPIEAKETSAKSEKPEKQAKLVVDLNTMNGIKVICMLYIISAHILMCFTLLLKNGQDHFNGSSLAYYLPYLVPSFSINGFFAITGILTSFTIFKENRSRSFLDKPINWLFLIIYRYLRVMPMYLITALYVKHVGRYTGSGPFWDYGTSSLSHRLLAEQESFSWILLFITNFKLAISHTIYGCWYLANDFQFFLVTPIFITILHKSPQFGQNFIKICILSGVIATVIATLTYDLDFRPVATFDLSMFMYICTYMYPTYGYPFFNIASYLIGLLAGYKLYLFALAKLESEQNATVAEPKWPEFFVKYGPTISFVSIGLQCISPLISSRLTYTKLAAKLTFCLMVPMEHVIFACAAASYILLAATGHGNKLVNWFLGHSLWKPLARLSLCVLLIQVEVISYFIQSATEMRDLETCDFTALCMFLFVVIYLVSAIAYVVFEAPIKCFFYLIIELMIARQQQKSVNEKESSKLQVDKHKMKVN